MCHLQYRPIKKYICLYILCQPVARNICHNKNQLTWFRILLVDAKIYFQSSGQLMVIPEVLQSTLYFGELENLGKYCLQNFRSLSRHAV